MADFVTGVGRVFNVSVFVIVVVVVVVVVASIVPLFCCLMV